MHRKVYAQFVEKFVAQVGALKVGDGLDPTTQMGPCINEQQLNTVMKYVQIGKDETAKLATGGHRLEGPAHKNGWFHEPTVFTDCSPKMRIAQEEIFGPVVSVIPFDNFDEALAIANGTDYGLAWQRAKKLNRPVLLHFHATWCGPCRLMERDVLNSPRVLQELNACCVAVKVDCDQQPALVQQFGVESLPCDILVTLDGKMHRVNLGFVSAEKYTSLISNSGKVRGATPIDVSSN